MRHHPALPKSHAIYTVALIGFIYTIHLVLPMYSGSSFLSLFVSSKAVGMIFMLGAVVTTLGFIITPFFIRKVGNYTTCLWLILFQTLLIYGIATTTDARLVAVFFILQTAIVALIGFCLDIFLEVYSNSAHVGAIRGMYLTTINSAWIITPLIGTMIIGIGNDYRSVYIASLSILFPLFYIIYKNFPKFKDPHYDHPSIFQTIAKLFKNTSHARLFVINIILQTFYALMVVYTPIYLNRIIGLSWGEIGIIITIMLIPFVLVEWPLGRLADKKYGEKEILILGLGFLGLSTIGLAAIISTHFLVWAFALFLTRVGAAAVEIMIETYFFKTTDARDPGTLGFFRITRSVSFFIAPLISGIVLLFTMDQSYLFIIIGVICLLAIIPAWKLHDTK